MNVLAIGAHPDDLEIGCGGSLYLHDKLGHKVHLILATNGWRSGDGEMRMGEQRRAARCLGDAVDVECLLIDDVVHDAGCFDLVADVFREIRPEVIYCHYGDDTHQEHRAVYDVTMSVARFCSVKAVLLYESVTSRGFCPNWYNSIHDMAVSAKLRGLLCHESQVERWGRNGKGLVDVVRAMMGFRGSQIGVDNAEGFVLYRMVMGNGQWIIYL